MYKPTVEAIFPAMPFVPTSLRTGVLASVLAWSAGTLAGAAASAQQPFYAEERIPELAALLAQAGENAPALVGQSLAREESVARLDAARAYRRPRVDLHSNIGAHTVVYERRGVDGETSVGANFIAVVRSPLYHWGAIQARIRQAELDQSNDDLQRALALRQIRRSLRANYLTLLVNEASLDNLRIRRELANAQLARQGAEQREGLLSVSDATWLALDREQNLVEIDRIESDQRRILDSFKREIGWSAPLALDQPIPSPDAAAVLAWVDSLRAGDSAAWLSDSAEVVRRRNLVEREREELTWIRSRMRPLVNASASAVRDQRNVAGFNNVNSMGYFIGLEVSWNVFDGLETSARSRESSARLRRIERNLEAYRAELAAQASNLLEQIGFLARQLTIDERRAVHQAEAFASAERDAAEGRLSAQTLNERRLSAHEFRVNALRSRVALLLALNDHLDLTLPVALTDASAP
jgi:outer membrane protein TolC